MPELPELEVARDAAAPSASRRHHTTSADYLEALAALGYRFALNDCNDTVEVNGIPISDVVAARIRTQMRDQGFHDIRAIENAYTAGAYDHRYHPVRNYLNSLRWDGQDHIDALARYLHTDHEPIRYRDGSQRRIEHAYLLRWLLGAVGKALDRRQNVMLVLVGQQGSGKSQFARWLGSGIPDYFIEGRINPDDKDSEVRLMSTFVWEVAELGATTRKTDVEALKDFISKAVVRVRKSYGRHDTVKPALASLIGTVNDNGAGFLNDETGTRRFLAFTLSKIGWSYTKVDVNQVWAQAVALYRQGEPHNLTIEEDARRRELNEQYEPGDLVEDYLKTYFSIATESKARMATIEGSHAAVVMVYYRIGMPK